MLITKRMKEGKSYDQAYKEVSNFLAFCDEKKEERKEERKKLKQTKNFKEEFEKLCNTKT